MEQIYLPEDHEKQIMDRTKKLGTLYDMIRSSSSHYAKQRMMDGLKESEVDFDARVNNAVGSSILDDVVHRTFADSLADIKNVKQLKRLGVKAYHETIMKIVVEVVQRKIKQEEKA